MKIDLKRVLWISIALAVVAGLFYYTEPSRITEANPLLLAASAAAFMGSIYAWFLSWNYLMKEPFIKCLKINTKALMGLFAPMGLGADFLRAYFSKKEEMSGSEAIAASFMVKFWKFLLMFFLLLLAIVLLATRTPDFSSYIVSFLAALIMTITGAIIVLLFRFKWIVRKIDKLFRKYYVMMFHEKLTEQFYRLNPKRTAVIVTFLILSVTMEIMTVYLLFMSLGVTLSLIHVFIFTTVAHSLALVPITPQGVGIAEGGGYLVLSMAFFSLSKGTIGSFLILWNIVRIWVPSAVGLIATLLDRGKRVSWEE